MQTTLPDPEDAGWVFKIRRVASEGGIENVPESRAKDASGQNPNQCIPDAVAIFAAPFKFALDDQRTYNNTNHHDHAIPAQREIITKYMKCVDHRINHVHLNQNFHKLYCLDSTFESEQQVVLRIATLSQILVFYYICHTSLVTNCT